MKHRFKQNFSQQHPPPLNLLQTYERTGLNMPKALTNHRRALSTIFLIELKNVQFARVPL